MGKIIRIPIPWSPQYESTDNEKVSTALVNLDFIVTVSVDEMIGISFPIVTIETVTGHDIGVICKDLQHAENVVGMIHRGEDVSPASTGYAYDNPPSPGPPFLLN